MNISPKFILAILSIFLTTHLSHAQLRGFLKKIDALEIQGGPGLVTLLSKNITSENKEMKIGYSVSVALLHSFNDKFSLNTNFFYSRKGMKSRYQVSYYDSSIDVNNCKCTTSIGTSEINSNLDYLTLAPLIRFKTKGTGLFLESGPFISYLLKSKTYVKNLWDNSTSYSNNDSIKDIDFGLSISIGYQFLVHDNIRLNIRLIDNYGLSNIGKSPIDDDPTRTNSFYLLVGLNF